MIDSLIWQSDKQYQCFLQEAKANFPPVQQELLDKTYTVFADKLTMMKLDGIIPYLSSLYADTGRPARNQAQLIRSFVLHSLSQPPLQAGGDLRLYQRAMRWTLF